MSYAPTIKDLLARTALRFLGALPSRVHRWIAGQPITIDGRQLAPEIQMGLKFLSFSSGEDFTHLPLSEGRAQLNSEAVIFGRNEPVPYIEEFKVPTRSGSVPARRYSSLPVGATQGTVVYFHGGGWVLGGLDSTDSTCRFIAKHTPFEVISIDYRLAPEHPFPAGIEDAIDAYRWARKERPDVPIAIAGDSAGANFTASVSLATVNDPDGPPDFQIMYCPCVDLSKKTRSYELFSTGFFLTDEQVDWYKAHYLRTPQDAFDPLVSPLLGDPEDIAKLPPAHIAVAGFDVLRDEGIAYAELLREAGVPVNLQIVEGGIHAFLNMTGVSKMSTRAFKVSVESLERGMLNRPRRARA